MKVRNVDIGEKVKMFSFPVLEISLSGKDDSYYYDYLIEELNHINKIRNNNMNFATINSMDNYNIVNSMESNMKNKSDQSYNQSYKNIDEDKSYKNIDEDTKIKMLEDNKILSLLMSSHFWIMALNDFKVNERIVSSHILGFGKAVNKMYAEVIYFNGKTIQINSISPKTSEILRRDRFSYCENGKDCSDFFLQTCISDIEILKEKIENKEDIDVLLVGGMTKEKLLHSNIKNFSFEDLLNINQVKIILNLNKGVDSLTKIKNDRKGKGEVEKKLNNMSCLKKPCENELQVKKKGKFMLVNLVGYEKDDKNNSILYPIDRRSLLGNPYVNVGILDKKKVIDQYEEYFYREIDNPNSKIYKGVKELIDLSKKYDEVHLGCWCAPGMCHGDIILDYLNNN